MSALLGVPAAAPADADVFAELVADGCAAARPQLEARLLEEPDAIELRRALADCLVELGDHPAARAVASESKADDPLLALAYAKAAYHMGDFEAARESLDRHSAALEQRADHHLYSGMSALALGEPIRAARELDRARRLDPAAVEPVASFHAGLAWRQTGEVERSDEAWNRVRNDWPGSQWSDRVERELSPRSLPSSLHNWAALELGLQYDSNVALLGERVDPPPDIERDEDGRFVWYARTGASYDLGETLSIGVQGAYSGSQHFEVSEFDVHYPSLALWLDTRMGAGWSARVLYDLGFAWIDVVPGDEFLFAQDLVFSLMHDAGALGRTTFDVGGRFDDYLFEVLDVNDSLARDGRTGASFATARGIDESAIRNRDGSRFRIGLSHAIPVGEGGEFAAAYHYENIETQGAEYDRRGHAFDFASSWSLPLALRAGLDVGYAYRPYSNPSSFPAVADFERARAGGATQPGAYLLDGSRKKRRDSRYDIALWMKRPITGNLALRAEWAYRRNRSNVEVFDSKRHRVGLFLELEIP